MDREDKIESKKTWELKTELCSSETLKLVYSISFRTPVDVLRLYAKVSL